MSMAEVIANNRGCYRAALNIDPANGEDLYQDVLVKIIEKENNNELSHVVNPIAYFKSCLFRAFLDQKRKTPIFVELTDLSLSETPDTINDIITEMLTEPAPSKRSIYRQLVVSEYLHLGTAEKTAQKLNIHTQSVYNAVRAFKTELKRRYDNTI